MQAIMLALSRAGVRIFRNNVGMGWCGEGKTFCARAPCTVSLQPGDVVLRKARPLHAGLFKGSGDLIGWRPVTITQAMVGTTIAQIVSAEVKQGRDTVKPDQQNWLDAMNRDGGLAFVARSEREALDALATPGAISPATSVRKQGGGAGLTALGSR